MSDHNVFYDQIQKRISYSHIQPNHQYLFSCPGNKRKEAILLMIREEYGEDYQFFDYTDETC